MKLVGCTFVILLVKDNTWLKEIYDVVRKRHRIRIAGKRLVLRMVLSASISIFHTVNSVIAVTVLRDYLWSEYAYSFKIFGDRRI